MKAIQNLHLNKLQKLHFPSLESIRKVYVFSLFINSAEYKAPNDITSEDHFRTNTLRFVRKEIDSKQFRDILRKNNIDANSGAVDKLLRQQDTGLPIKYDDLILSIRKNKAEHISHNHHNPEIVLHTEPPRMFYTESDVDDRKLTKNVVFTTTNLKSPYLVLIIYY
jgi:hypothetical protein